MKDRIKTAHNYLHNHKILKYPYSILIIIAGIVLIIAGILMLILPGPGLLTIFAGVAVLATQFTWAKNLLLKTKKTLSTIKNKLTKRRTKTVDTSLANN